MENIVKLKFDIMNEIQKSAPVFIKVGSNQYRIRCPFCGDSQSNPRAAHMYIKCDYDSDEPILYNCFKGNCGASGRLNKDFIDKLGINIDGIDALDNRIFNKIISFKNLDVDIICGDPIMDSNQVKYIEWRLGKGFTYDDYNKFKIIWDDQELRNQLGSRNVYIPQNIRHISFLSSDKSMLLSRSYNDEPYRWLKTKLLKSSNISEYTISTNVDLFTDEKITINIAEGIFDVLSIYKNFNTGPNSVYLAVLCDKYESGIRSIITKGLFGKNVNINIFLDSNIDLRIIRKFVQKYKWMFGKIIAYTNIIGGDVGTTIDKIKLKEIKL